MWIKRFKKAILLALLAIFVPIIMFFTYYSFSYTMWFTDIAPGNAILMDVKDSLPLHLAVFAGVVVLLGFVNEVFRKERKQNELYLRILLYSVMVIVFALCLWWVVNGNFFAQNDSRYVLEAMEKMHIGDWSELLPAGYIGAYKQHLGLMTLFQIIFTVTGTTNDIVIQIVNVICVLAIIYMGFYMLREITSKCVVRAYYCLFMLFCFPLFFYTPYVYGEIISATAGMGFIYGGICYLKRGKVGAWIAMSVCAVVGNMARGNFPVLLIAFAIIAFLYAIRRRKLLPVICALSIFLITGGANALNTFVYEQISGIELNQGVPIEAWVAMGLSDAGEGECGMYNGYNIDTYAETGYNREATREKSLAYISDRIKMFLNGAGRGPAEFYKAKILLQWNDPTLNCFMENRSYIEEPHPFILNIIDANDGVYQDEARELMNQYQWILYVGVLFYCILLLREDVPFYSVLVLTVLVGGFLMTVIWEAMSRYVFPYVIYMIPLAAVGWYNLLDVLRGLCSIAVNKINCLITKKEVDRRRNV